MRIFLITLDERDGLFSSSCFAILRNRLGVLAIRLARLVARLRRARHIRRLLRLRNGILRQVVIGIRRRGSIRILRRVIKRIRSCVAIGLRRCSVKSCACRHSP